MKKRFMVLVAACFWSVPVLSCAQAAPVTVASSSINASAMRDQDPVHTVMQKLPWDLGVFFGGGLDVSGETSDHFLNAGIRVGKVLTSAEGPGILHGQFELAGELMPYWQAFTPRQTYISPSKIFTTGGTYSGVSLTPIVLRWNLARREGHAQRVMPWLQGAGGFIWTNHKFPPNGLQRTSVWNFTPQFGVGVHYFVKPRQAITFTANAVHISNASLGDTNPGVNATVQFQLGYTWWR